MSEHASAWLDAYIDGELQPDRMEWVAEHLDVCAACSADRVAPRLARKLAMLFWRVMVKGLDYVEDGPARYDAKVLETKQRALRRLAKELGQELVPVAQGA